MMPRPKSSNLIEVLNKQALIGKSSDWNLSKYFLPHSSTVIFSLSLKSGRNGNASHSHSFWQIRLIFSPVVGRPVQRSLFEPNQRSNQLSWFKFEPNQRSNQIFGVTFHILPNQRFYQIFWFEFEPIQSSSQISGLTFLPNQSFNQILCEIILLGQLLG